MDSNTQHYFRNVFVPLEGRAGWAHKSLPLSIDVLLKVGDGIPEGKSKKADSSELGMDKKSRIRVYRAVPEELETFPLSRFWNALDLHGCTITPGERHVVEVPLGVVYTGSWNDAVSGDTRAAPAYILSSAAGGKTLGAFIEAEQKTTKPIHEREELPPSVEYALLVLGSHLAKLRNLGRYPLDLVPKDIVMPIQAGKPYPFLINLAHVAYRRGDDIEERQNLWELQKAALERAFKGRLSCLQERRMIEALIGSEEIHRCEPPDAPKLVPQGIWMGD